MEVYRYENTSKKGVTITKIGTLNKTSQYVIVCVGH